MIRPASYANGFAPRDGMPLYPSLWKNCVGAWAPCLGPSGATLRDWSGSGRHGTLTNMDTGEDWVTSGGRYALDLDGTNDYVEFSPTDATTVHTISLWIYNRDAGDAIIVGGVTNIYGLYTDTNGSGGSVYYSASTGNFKGVTHGGMESTWTHLAVTRNETELTFYKNGKSLGSQTLTTNDAASFRYFGREGGGFYADMQIDDAVIVNRVMPQKELILRASRRGVAYELAPLQARKSSSGNRRRRALLRVN